uniref:Uncharacterized protein n=1 Tax=Knipowitschia caucasica TaxID=637954 RepID=A0AAV2JYJ7_KNICA
MLNGSKLKTELSLIYSKAEFRACCGAVDLFQLFMENNLQDVFSETIQTSGQSDFRTERLWDRATLGQSDSGTERLWDRATLGQSDSRTERLRDRATSGQIDFGTERLQGRTTPGQSDFSTERLQDRATPGQSDSRTERLQDRATPGQSDSRTERLQDRATPGQSDSRTAREEMQQAPGQEWNGPQERAERARAPILQAICSCADCVREHAHCFSANWSPCAHGRQERQDGDTGKGPHKA